MSESLALERSVLERKERDELATIAQALGLKPTARSTKTAIVDQILRSAGVDTEQSETPKPRRGRKPKAEAEPTLASTEDFAGAAISGPPASPSHVDSVAAETVRTETVRPETVRTETVRTETVRTEIVQTETGRADGQVNESNRNESNGNESSGNESSGNGSSGNGSDPRSRPARGPRRGSPSALFDPFAEAADVPAPALNDDDLFSVAGRSNGVDSVEPAPSESNGSGSEDRPRFERSGRPIRSDQLRYERSDRPERTQGGRPYQGRLDEARTDQAGRPDGARSEEHRSDQARPDSGGQARPDQARTDNGGQARPDQARPEGRPDNRPGQGPRPGDQPRFKFDDDLSGSRNRRKRRRGRERDTPQRMDPQRDAAVEQVSESYQGDLLEITGLLDLDDKGYGYIRAKGYTPSANDVYVPVNKAKQLGLRKGDSVVARYRPALPQEKFAAIVSIDLVAGVHPDVARLRPKFEDLTPLFPDVRLRLETPGEQGNMVSRIIDLISPVGKGQRGLIVSPPKAGKTTIMKQVACSIERNNPEVHLMVLLVDERPEEVTDMRRTVKTAEVVASTFDRPGDEHTALAELAIERAKRLVEAGKDVVIILDGITRLARAYNFAAPATGRIMSGGLDAGALYPPKRFFGAARNVEEGGSLTILATALIETGSLMDNVIFEEFKGTGNMELRLDRRLAEKRIFPAINVNESSTRHDELLFTRPQSEAVTRLRRVLVGLAADGSAEKGLEILMERLKATVNNDVFLAEIAKAPQTPS